MNGECKSYRLGSPMNWEEFKSMPEEHQKTYIQLLRKKYDVPDVRLADAMGVDRVVFGRWIRCLGLGLGKGAAAKARWWNDTEFLKWWHGVKEEKKEEPVKLITTYTDFDGAEKREEHNFDMTLCDVHDDNSLTKIEDNTKLVDLVTSEMEQNRIIADKVEPVVEEGLTTTAAYGYGFGPGYTYDIDGDTCFSGPGPVICTTPYLPVIPKNGTMTFEHNDADDALATIKALLSNVKVNLTISWECVFEED